MSDWIVNLGELPSAVGTFVAALMVSHGLVLAVTAPITVLVLVLVRHGLGWVRQHRWRREARLVEILPPPKSDLAGAEDLWRQMLGTLRPWWKRVLFGQPHLVWEYAMSVQGLRIRMWVPGPLPPGMVERAISSAWPGASATTRTISTAQGELFVHGGQVRLARPDHYPIQHQFEEDPLRALIGAAGDLTGQDQVLVQVGVRPVTGRRLRRANRAASSLRYDYSPNGGVFDALTPGGHRSANLLALRPEVGREIQAILNKSTQPRLETHVRYLVFSPGRDSDARQRRRGRAHAVAAAWAVFSGHNYYQRHRFWLRAWSRSQDRTMGSGDLLTARELAAIAHLPLDETVPGLQRAPARPVPPPPQVAVDLPEARVLGTAEHSERRTIAQRTADARQHTHIIGGTGVGKTTLLMGMALDDIAKGRGVVIIEPKGESDLLLSRMPESALERVILIDPDDDAPPPSLNVLGGTDPVRTADMVTGTFSRIYRDNWGPRTDDILRSCCLTLAASPQASLSNIPKLLENASFRKRTIAHLDEDSVLAGFWRWYDNLSDPARSHATAPLLNKLRAVLLRDFARDLLAARPRESLDMSTLLDDRAVIIARLPKGVVGEDTSSLLGSLILAQTWNGILARARQREADRVDTGLYLDEAQNFLTLPFGLGDMLAEARAYRAGLTMAHQDLAQLTRDLREATSANARSKVFFDLSPEDAHHLGRHVHPEITEHDLSHLARYQAAARLVTNGALSPAFTLRTRPLPPPIPGRATAVRKAARTNRTR